MLETALLITQALLGAAVLCAVVRVFRGPSVLDRVIAVDVTLLVVSSMLLVDMIARDHRDFVLFVIAGAMIGFLGAVAIARFIPVRRHEQVARPDPAAAAAGETRTAGTARTAGAEPSRPTSEAVGDEDPATSWFTALARSRREEQRRARARQDHDEDHDEGHGDPEGAGRDGADRREEER
ncbi:monovalent cation/H+ antiporter complex subunit F [Nesterenkonia sp. F]|uniref:monovalent cation/H+ antiporter complex subunit F n=1 Tax=Nesterenkonia sp. F TaxID=795955 RepID=UPI000255D395|nr:monovalent cation/H+ antiporter complex subunit F [Nesterenkonia sp. F]